MEELSLVFFTVLAQSAAGLSFALYGMRLVDRENHLAPVLKKSVTTILVLIVFGGIASLTHLGQPFNAFNILNGLGHGSMLSIEVAFVALFSLSILGLFYFVSKNHALGNSAGLYMICMLLGLIMVFSISNVYNISTVSAWNTILTPIQFFMTTLLLGFVLASYFVSSMKDSMINKFVKVGSIIAVSIYLIFLPLSSNFYGAQEVASQFAMNDMWSNIRFITLGLGLILWFIPQLLNSSATTKKIYISAAVVILFCSELAGRVYFYDLLNLRIL